MNLPDHFNLSTQRSVCFTGCNSACLTVTQNLTMKKEKSLSRMAQLNLRLLCH